ncbi:MAG: MerR family transcriptional regulator [Oscillospiraceae bacterium]
MQDLYKINEIAKLFSLCPDTLRYYEEKGLISPERRENGYRMYSIQDICTLNIVRSLRELGMPLGQIRDYLEKRSVEETLRFIDREDDILDRKMEALRAARREVDARRGRLLEFEGVADGTFLCRELPPRPYVFLQENVILEREIDFLLKKLEKKHQDYIKIIGNQCMGAILDTDCLQKGIYSHFSCVFFLTPPKKPRDAELPGGTYASLFYRGSYEALPGHLRTLMGELNARGLSPIGPPLELYHVDAHDTNLESEYLTELQLPVKSV